LGTLTRTKPLGFPGELPAEVHHRAGPRPTISLAAPEDFFTSIAQAQFARGALQQANGQGLVPGGQMLRLTAEGELRQLARSCGEAARLDHLHETPPFQPATVTGRLMLTDAQVH
jgi:hypothetical protein